MGYKIKGRNTFLNEYEDINRNYSGNVTNNIESITAEEEEDTSLIENNVKGPNKNFYLCYEKDVKSTESVVGEIPIRTSFGFKCLSLEGAYWR